MLIKALAELCTIFTQFKNYKPSHYIAIGIVFIFARYDKSNTILILDYIIE